MTIRRNRAAHLDVFSNMWHAGRLTREKSGAISFTYADEYIAQIKIPISISMPIRKEPYVGDVVVAVFENMLPDDEMIRRRAGEQAGSMGIDAFSLLTEIGRDCVGAIQLFPEGNKPQQNPSDLFLSPVSDEEIGRMLDEINAAPLGIRRDNDIRISVGGVQGKISLFRFPPRAAELNPEMNGWFKPEGATPTSHIVKPQIGDQPGGMDLSNSVENEYMCLKLLKGFGLNVAQAEIKQFGNHKALVVERFDRMRMPGEISRDLKDILPGSTFMRFPQEDCCQALSFPPTRKYQNQNGPGIVEIMNLLVGSNRANEDRKDFFMATILFWLIGATDGHAKNFSIWILPKGGFHLQPFYDVLTAQPEVDAKRIRHKDFKLAMCFGKNRHYKIHDVRGRHIMETGRESGLSKKAIEEIFKEIHAQADSAFEHVRNNLPQGFPMPLLEFVENGMKDRLKYLYCD